jgi:hypothetical protein
MLAASLRAFSLRIFINNMVPLALTFNNREIGA